MNKVKVGIIFGGESTEHEVSRRSAVHIITSIDRTKYDFVLIEVSKKGVFSIYEECSTAELTEKLTDMENELPKETVSVSEDIFIDNEIDVVFSVIHGTGGEDGVLQGFLELCGVPYVGAGVMASAAGFDKAVSKMLFREEGIPQADYITVCREGLNENSLKKEVREKLGYPVFIKPSNGGSSVGIYKVKQESELIPSVKKASSYDRKIVIEAFVPGREFECAVLGGYTDAKALGVGEIVPCNEFYDYNAKYIDEDSVGIIPAPVGESLIKEIKEYSEKAFRAIDCHGLARVDFFITDDNRVILNEINTMPGFTSISMYPKIWAEFHGTDTDLITRLIELAFERKEKYRYLKDYCGDA